MKKKAILLILSALVLAATGACALTATAAAPNYAEAAAVPAASKIEVIGSAEITAEADTCVIGGQAECVGNTAGEAAALCAEKAAAIRAAAAPFGTVRVTDNGSGPVYNGTGCYALAYVTVTTHEVARVSEIKAALADAGLGGYINVSYGCSESGRYESRALAAAAEDACAKAAALGASGRPLRLSEEYCSETYGADAFGTTTVTFTAQVRAVFAADAEIK